MASPRPHHHHTITIRKNPLRRANHSESGDYKRHFVALAEYARLD
jgi:hypothetical protein